MSLKRLLQEKASPPFRFASGWRTRAPQKHFTMFLSCPNGPAENIFEDFLVVWTSISTSICCVNDVSEKASPRKGFSTFPFRLWLARLGAKKTLLKSDLDETLDGRLPPEDNSDFDDFWTELIVMT